MRVSVVASGFRARRRSEQGPEAAVLRTSVRRAIMRVIAQLLPAEIAACNPAAGDPSHDHHRQRPSHHPPRGRHRGARALRAADRGVADPPWSLESVLSDNTRRVYAAQWKHLSTTGAATMGLRALPADPLTVARYLAVRGGVPAPASPPCAWPPPPSPRPTSSPKPRIAR